MLLFWRPPSLIDKCWNANFLHSSQAAIAEWNANNAKHTKRKLCKICEANKARSSPSVSQPTSPSTKLYKYVLYAIKSWDVSINWLAPWPARRLAGPWWCRDPFVVVIVVIVVRVQVVSRHTSWCTQKHAKKNSPHTQKHTKTEIWMRVIYIYDNVCDYYGYRQYSFHLYLNDIRSMVLYCARLQ